MLALGAAGIVWVAIKQRPAATAAVAALPASASALPTEATPIGDSGQPVTADARTLPPPASDAAWSVVRWSMSAADVEVALKAGGAVVTDATDPKTGTKRLRAKSGPWEATIDFGANGAQQIVVTTTGSSKEAAHAVVATMNARAPATKTIERTERRWKGDGGGFASLVTSVDDATATLREEHVRESAPGGELGFAALRWGMSTQEVFGHLRPAGYAAHLVNETVQFDKDGVQGTASFNQFGLRRVVLSGPTLDGGAARAKELETALGEPASLEVSTKTQHVDQARMTSIDVEVTERPAGGGLTVVETYRPTGKR